MEGHDAFADRSPTRAVVVNGSAEPNFGANWLMAPLHTMRQMFVRMEC